MLSTFALVLLSTTVFRSDTTVVLGRTERDLTGDGRREVLTLVGTGKTIDSLDVTLTITSLDQTIYRKSLMPITRRIGYDGVPEMRTAAEQRKFLSEFGSWFFGAGKFVSSHTFLDTWGRQAPARVAEIPAYIAADGRFPSNTARGRAIWTRIQRSGVTIFEFSPGGDGLTAIAWSAGDRRFYHLIGCC